ncbi:SDR family NAD(P)-dependent oxidoreductase [Georgenia alba]|uniref:SDR family NAD(P)-dependent oxidoreductase n=1 Tax=Georgenia alba TaxID=2233858 RepID=A0ABW2QB22_9MICO
MWSREEFDGVTCLVTGAAGGIGHAVCRALHDAGATVRAVDVAEPASGPWQEFVSCDITSAADLGRLADRLGDHPLDVLVNTAGIMRKAPVGQIDWDAWDLAYAVNCRGTLRLTEQVLDRLRASGRGRIVNIVSMTASLGLPTYAPYSSAKAALLNASRVLGAELAGSGITVNSISPGWVETPMIEPLFTRMEELHDLPAGQGRAYVEGLIPQHRLVDPAEVAAAVMFLASRAGGAITGHDLRIDGGLTSMFAPGVHAG